MCDAQTKQAWMRVIERDLFTDLAIGDEAEEMGGYLHCEGVLAVGDGIEGKPAFPFLASVGWDGICSFSPRLLRGAFSPSLPSPPPFLSRSNPRFFNPSPKKKAAIFNRIAAFFCVFFRGLARARGKGKGQGARARARARAKKTPLIAWIKGVFGGGWGVRRLGGGG